jgi:hypothetical protein
MAIRFTKPYTTKEGPDDSRTFEEGEVVDFLQEYKGDEPDGSTPDAERERQLTQRARASEQHFISRGVAVREGEEQQTRKGGQRQRSQQAEGGKQAEGGRQEAPAGRSPAGRPAGHADAGAQGKQAEPAGQPHVLPREQVKAEAEKGDDEGKAGRSKR